MEVFDQAGTLWLSIRFTNISPTWLIGGISADEGGNLQSSIRLTKISQSKENLVYWPGARRDKSMYDSVASRQFWLDLVFATMLSLHLAF